MFLGVGDGTFEPALAYPDNYSAAAPTVLTIADLNGDGRPDVVFEAPYNSRKFGVFLNGDNGLLAAPATVIDETPPTVAITAEPTPTSLSSSATFAFTAADPVVGGVSSGLSQVEISLDGAPFAPATSPITFNSLSNANHTFQLEAFDNAGNMSTVASYSWTVNTTAPPAVVSIHRNTPTGTFSGGGTVTYTVIFDGVVTGVDPTDFQTVASTGVTAGAIAVSGSGATYTATVSGVAGNGTLQLQVVDDDSIVAVVNGKPLGGAGTGNGNFLGDPFDIDQTGPTATFTAQPAAFTQATSATFSFAGTDPTMGGVASGVNHFEYSIDGSPFAVASSPLTLNNLSIAAHTLQARAVDNLGNDGTPISYSWTIDRTDPFVQSIVQTTPSASPTNAATIAYTVTFSEPVTGVDVTDFKLAATGTLTAMVSQVTGSGASWTVTVGSIVGDGTVALDLVDDGTIRDLAGNKLDNPNAPFTVGPANNYTTGFFGQTAAVADFDRNGTLDVAVDGEGGSQTDVFLGNGNGTLQAPKAIAGLSGSENVIAADMNGDGIPDIVEESSSPAGVAVLLGNGNGTFQAPRTLSSATPITKFAVADVNHDGKLDVITTTSGTVSVYLGNGDGTLKAPITMASGQSAYLLVADLNGDGIPDLLVGNSRDNDVAVYIGNGDGTFALRNTFAATYPAGLALGDVTGDGIPDLMTSDYSGHVYLFKGNGNGTFQAPIAISSPNRPRAIDLVDMNGDGALDLVIGHVGAPPRSASCSATATAPSDPRSSSPPAPPRPTTIRSLSPT